MTERNFTFRARAGARAKVVEATAYGLLNFGHGVETAAKRNAPVRGGHRSFAPDGPVGGTLRRSIHTVVYLDGRRIGGPATDGNGAQLPAYVPVMGVVLYVGTNSGYGLWVHEGTTRMAGRPFLLEGLTEVRGQAPALIAAGARRRLGA